MAEFCCFVVIMIWVNLRVSLVTGAPTVPPTHTFIDSPLSKCFGRNQPDHLAVHAAVVATLVTFFVAAVLPVWPYLESGYVRPTARYVRFNWLRWECGFMIL
jgi:hypothetical protein